MTKQTDFSWKPEDYYKDAIKILVFGFLLVVLALGFCFILSLSVLDGGLLAVFIVICWGIIMLSTFLRILFGLINKIREEWNE